MEMADTIEAGSMLEKYEFMLKGMEMELENLKSALDLASVSIDNLAKYETYCVEISQSLIDKGSKSDEINDYFLLYSATLPLDILLDYRKLVIRHKRIIYKIINLMKCKITDIDEIIDGDSSSCY